MKTSIVGTVGVPACYGGFETLVENLLSDEDENNLIVYCSSKHYKKKAVSYKNAQLKYIPLKANGAQSIPYDILSLMHAVFINKSKNILVLGVSGAIAIPFLKLFSRARFITNIDGLEWKRDKWGALVKRFLKFSEKIAVKYSDVIVSDNQAIADYVEAEYGVSSKVIAYGGDHAVTGEISDNQSDYALALCRIEPENNVELILKAFSQTKEKLIFIGNWGNSDFGRAMKLQYQQFSNIEIVDPIYDLEVLSKFRSECKLYIHGHSAGGTNPSLVEMMHFEKTILCFDCNYNRATTEQKAFYFSDVASLIKLINSSDSIDNSQEMLSIAKKRYTWAIVKKQYFTLFQ